MTVPQFRVALLGGAAASGFPLAISGLQILLEAAAGAKVGGANCTNADPCDTWADTQSGGGRSVVQATGANRPIFLTGQTPGGRPCLRGDGLTQYLKATGFTLAQPCSIFLYARLVAQAVNDYWHDGNAADTFAAYQKAIHVYRMYAGADGPVVDPGVGSWHLIYGAYNGAASEARLDGGTAATGNPGAGSPGGLTLFAAAGGGSCIQADYAAVAVYNRILSDGERQQVEAYFTGY